MQTKKQHRQKVSIPHRYGKNLIIVCKSERISSVSIPHRYGKNSIDVLTDVRSAWFPFLIGTVRTLIQVIVVPQDVYVSIPHRYGKNGAAARIAGSGAPGSFHSS